MYYTVYNKQDEVIAHGNSIKCAEQLGMSIDVFFCMVSRVLKGKNKKYKVVKMNDS